MSSTVPLPQPAEPSSSIVPETTTTTTQAVTPTPTPTPTPKSASTTTSKGNRTDQAMRLEADSYVKTKSFYPEPCRHFKPTIEELQSTTFSDFVRNTVLRMSERGYDESDDEEEEELEEEDVETEEDETVTEESAAAAAAAAAAVIALSSAESRRPEGNDTQGNVSDETPSSPPSTTAKATAATPTQETNPDPTPEPTPTVHTHNTRHKSQIRPPSFERRNVNNNKNHHVSPTKPDKYKPNSPIVHYDYGIAKITLPEGCSTLNGIAKDQTGRGPMWQPGTDLGDRKVFNHKQVVRGLGGIYEYTFFDHVAMTVSEFRRKADEYQKAQLGHRPADHGDVEVLERKFWKRLGPTMTPAFYGADMEGTLFDEDDECQGWNVSKLKSCLQLLLMDQDDGDDDEGKKGIPGVTTPYLYYGMWASVFCAHTEDMNLLSINYLHAGAPKVWYAVPAGHDARRFEELMASSYQHAKRDCPEYLRHKRSLISPAILKKTGIPFTTTVQYPGDAIVTFPGSYHFGFNTGFNVAEATNFAVPEWIPYGRQAKVCLCRPDSVRFDMNKFEQLLLQYEHEVRQSKRFMWADWVARKKKKRAQEEIANASYGSSPNKAARTETKVGHRRTKDFWVEVVQPSKRSSSSKSKKNKKIMKSDSKSAPKSVKKGPKTEWDEESWHLAKPAGRKSFQPSSRVLCIIPAVVTDDPISNKRKPSKVKKRFKQSSDSSDEDDEQCFSGSIVEILDGHARIRLDGLTKLDDVWMEV
eukprot:CAMPEP_0113519954 /NCGR_PEP_ID=MMETSP0014_2-20120614/43808_1 /TAXON_ID=2857 /ORGANISM="Nitzschia sp." /LENGTH=753 /DNA_ID=CAMNT_0000417733 /DNA_START=161 /DNA_END=2419 /DNA_ORIENTATION=+ /assembly_acc=CAM_ASM_000159